MKVLIELDDTVLKQAEELANKEGRSRKKTIEKIVKDFFP